MGIFSRKAATLVFVAAASVLGACGLSCGNTHAADTTQYYTKGTDKFFLPDYPQKSWNSMHFGLGNNSNYQNAYCITYTKTNPRKYTGSLSNLYPDSPSEVHTFKGNDTSAANKKWRQMFNVMYYGERNNYSHQAITLALDYFNTKTFSGSLTASNWIEGKGGIGKTSNHPFYYSYAVGSTPAAAGTPQALIKAVESGAFKETPGGSEDDLSVEVFKAKNGSYQDIAAYRFVDNPVPVKETISASVDKEWVDDRDKSGNIDLPPEFTQVKIMLHISKTYNGRTYTTNMWNKPINLKKENNWHYETRNLQCSSINQIIKANTDLPGNAISQNDMGKCTNIKLYFTEETDNTTEGGQIYSTKSVTKYVNGAWRTYLTNKYRTVSVQVNKTWKDDNSVEQNDRPDWLVFKIEYATKPDFSDAKTYIAQHYEIVRCGLLLDTSLGDSITDETKNYYCGNIGGTGRETFRFDDLPMYGYVNGTFKQIYYRAIEIGALKNATPGHFQYSNATPVTNYILPSEEDQIATYKRMPSADKEYVSLFYIYNTSATNIEENEDKTVTVSKKWERTDTTHPDSVEVYLTCGGEKYGDNVTLSEPGWEYTWTIPNDCDPNVQEVAPEGYTWTVTKTSGDNTQHFKFRINNTRDEQPMQIPVEKVWADENDTDRPESIEVTLVCADDDYDPVIEDGVENPVTLDATNGWKYTWTNLYRSYCGRYAVREKKIEGYSVSYTGDENKFFITNKKRSTQVDVKKVWYIAEGKQKPEYVEANLVCADDNRVIETVKLNEGNNWSYAWKNLSLASCKKYTVTENAPEGFNSYIRADADDEDSYTIFNDEYVAVPVKKTWNVKDSSQIQEVSVDLMCGDEVVETINLNKSNDWKHTFERRLRSTCMQGFTVRENLPEDGKIELVKIKGNEADYEIINTDIFNIPVKKVWHNDKKSDRPGYIDVSLMCGDDVINTVRLSEENNKDGDNVWSYTWTGLRRSDCAKYTVREDFNIPGYNTEVTGNEDGYTITNTKAPNTLDDIAKWGSVGVGTTAGLVAAGFVIRRRMMRA